MPSFTRTAASLALTVAAFGMAAPAQAQDKYLSEVFPVAFDFCPRFTLPANGQQLAIQQNQALFSLLGTTYGGNGVTTFALPDLRGRSPMHTGQGPGLSSVTDGQVFGTETTTLTVANMPAHTHADQMRVSRVNGTTNTAVNGYIARAGNNVYTSVQPTGDLMPADAITSSIVGGGQAFSNMQPGLVINYCVVVLGLFPSRN
jgi:microcystin-dependent protein